ncbi:MAG: TatD family hydrolase [Alphaproteobacteria bacterium]|nr:TatD family hydrolase [Alphaproteobacteria bacterium]
MNKYTKTLLQGGARHTILKGMKYTDAHCHIFSAPIDDAIIGQICNATNTADWEELTPIADDRTHICIGIHPWHIDSVPDDWVNRMHKILLSNPQIMIGEIGIDKYHPNMERQVEVFARQIEIAIEFDRPIHLHCVGAWDKVLHIFKSRRPHTPIVAHAFSGNAEIMTGLAEYDTYFSYKIQDNRINNTTTIAPFDKILVESDCNNASHQLEILATTTHEIAKLRGCDTRELNEQINKNFNGVINYA